MDSTNHKPNRVSTFSYHFHQTIFMPTAHQLSCQSKEKPVAKQEKTRGTFCATGSFL
jgi:hypothetical protein